MWVGGQRHALVALSPGNRPATHRTGGGVGPREVWTGAENVVPTGIRSPDRPALIEPPYRLSYPGPLKNLGTTSKFLAPKWLYKKGPV